MLKYTISLTLILAAIWLLFSGLWTHPVILPLGAASVALTVWLAYRLGILDREGHPLHLVRLAPRYWAWLLVQITRANLVVARAILSPSMSISPRIDRVRCSQKTPLGRTILANSITLTPGTVSVHVRENEIWFYALTEDMARDLQSGEMDRRVTEFEGED